MALHAVAIRRSMNDYGMIREIYKKSFPRAEQCPVWMLRLMSHRKGIHSEAFYDREVLCGFCYYMVNEKTVFILYLAVNPDARSKGYGSQILTWLKEMYQGRTLFLDAEKKDEKAPNAVQRIRRMEFYRKNGILETNHFFDYDDVSYEILSTDREFGRKEYKENIKSFFRIFQQKKSGRDAPA